MAAFPPVDMQIQSADPNGLIRAVLENVLASVKLTPALHRVCLQQSLLNYMEGGWGGG